MSENKISNNKLNHDIELKCREKLKINGVKEIISFDENEIHLITQCGDMAIDGDNMHINVLDIAAGNVELIGKINGINYSDSVQVDKKSILSRIFR